MADVGPAGRIRMFVLTRRHCTFHGRMWELAPERRPSFAAEGPLL
jgi:hypothetical protein